MRWRCAFKTVLANCMTDCAPLTTIGRALAAAGLPSEWLLTHAHDGELSGGTVLDRSKGCDNQVYEVRFPPPTGLASVIFRSPAKAPEAQPHAGHRADTQAWVLARLAAHGVPAPRCLAWQAPASAAGDPLARPVTGLPQEDCDGPSEARGGGEAAGSRAAGAAPASQGRGWCLETCIGDCDAGEWIAARGWGAPASAAAAGPELPEALAGMWGQVGGALRGMHACLGPGNLGGAGDVAVDVVGVGTLVSVTRGVVTGAPGVRVPCWRVVAKELQAQQPSEPVAGDGLPDGARVNGSDCAGMA
jgi:hypothetical protein